MSKKIQDENGNTYVAVKPWYKKWWVWAIVVILVLIGFGSLENDSDSSSSSSSSSSNNHSEKSSSVQKKSTEPMGKLVTLGAGKFTVGKDIKPGRYVITTNSGDGNLSDDNDMNVILSSQSGSSSDGVDSYTTTLPKGDKVEISGIDSTTFTPVKKRTYKTLLGAGQWEVGKDIKPGHYVITSTQGSGNISTDDGDINEILGKTKDSDTGQVTNITADLSNGQVLETDLEQIQLTEK